MSSLCIKTNNKKVLEYLQNEFSSFNMLNTFYSQKQFKHYKNIIIHYTGIDKELFYTKLATILSYLVIDYFETDIIKQILHLNYFYFEESEFSTILNLCEENLCDSSEFSFPNRQLLLFDIFHEYISTHHSIVLSGFINFRLNKYRKLIEDLVEASKVSTGNVKLQIEKINIVELLNQAIGEFEDKFEVKKLEILLEAKESEIYILADSRYMYRIVENLFSNISKYALENSRVYIDIIKKSNEVYIEIKNISKEKLNISAEELMQRFVRGDKSRTTEGSGLGISIAQNLTEIQKGVFNLKLDGDLFRVELIFNIL